MTVLLVAAGVVLLAALATDVFLTVFAIQGTGGPITMQQSRAVWAVFRRLGTRADGSPRESLLQQGGPTILILNFMTWILLLVVGFALIYLPFLSTDFLFSRGHLRIPFWEAVYFSAQSAPTLGTGDMIPDRQWLRIVEVVEAMAGFALVTSSITYLLAIYEELLAMHSTATVIANYFGEGLTRMLERLEVVGGEEVGAWSETIAGNVTRALEAHYQYPIVHYFRVRDRRRAFPVQLGRLLDLERALLEGRPTPAIALQVGSHPSYRGLLFSIREYLEEVEDHFVPVRFRRSFSEQESDNTVRAYARLLLYLRYDEAAYGRRPGLARAD